MGVGSKLNVGVSSPRKNLQEYMPFAVVWCLLINSVSIYTKWLAASIYFTSAH